tara:strand:- start:197 stop:400 length:204 start_codon:yes stop_codon:yes gene_type:complete
MKTLEQTLVLLIISGLILSYTKENYDALIYYVDKLEDVDAFVKLVDSSQLPKSNRTIMFTEKDEKME